MTEAQEQGTEEKPAESEAKPDDGHKFVEMPPEVEARFKHTYANMKQYERIADQMAGKLREAHERIEKMEEDRTKQSASDRTAQLRAEEKAALEEGDYAKASAARDQITDLKVESKVPKPEKKEEEPWLTPEREDYMAEWAAEKNDKGDLLRPWAHPEHEDHQKMVNLAESMIKRDPNIPLVTLLDHWEIEARKQSTKRTAAPVLTGASDVRPDTKKKSLSEDEKLIVRRMYPKMPPKEAEERYLKSKEMNS